METNLDYYVTFVRSRIMKGIWGEHVAELKVIQPSCTFETKNDLIYLRVSFLFDKMCNNEIYSILKHGGRLLMYRYDPFNHVFYTDFVLTRE